jgi:PAS domain S-box-containing protein
MSTNAYVDDKPALPGPEGIPHADPDPFDRDRAEMQLDYIVVYDYAGKILYVNPAMVKAMGYGAERMVGTSLLSYVAEEYRKNMIATMAAHHETGEVPLYEISLLNRDGHRKSVIVKGRLIRYNNIPATLLFLIDITQRKDLEDQLTARAKELLQISTAFQQANKKLNLLSTITRHDIGNQLTVLIGYLGLLETKQPDPILTGYCKKASVAAEQISAMIRFTREYEEVGITAPKWQECRSIADTAAKQAPLGNVRVKNDLPAGTEIFADPLVVKVFYNLMDNAVRYGNKITSIRISAVDCNKDLIIVCEDDGDGVAACEKDRIFDRGFGKHTGLGLALSREILDITGIRIRETGEPGAGARFEIIVPGGAWRGTVTREKI